MSEFYPKVDWEVRRKGNFVTVCEFNDGHSHIAVDDHCWVVLNNGRRSSFIFQEAATILRKLPTSPDNYVPYRQFVGADVE